MTTSRPTEGANAAKRKAGRPRVYPESRRRTALVVPESLLDDIDALVGAGNRNQFIVDALRRAVAEERSQREERQHADHESTQHT